jgi:hypothetical protein
MVALMMRIGIGWKLNFKTGFQVLCSELAFGFQVKGSREITQCSPSGLEPMPRTSEALTAQYLLVCQRKFGNIIIQTVHILQHDSAATAWTK